MCILSHDDPTRLGIRIGIGGHCNHTRRRSVSVRCLGVAGRPSSQKGGDMLHGLEDRVEAFLAEGSLPYAMTFEGSSSDGYRETEILVLKIEVRGVVIGRAGHLELTYRRGAGRKGGGARQRRRRYTDSKATTISVRTDRHRSSLAART